VRDPAARPAPLGWLRAALADQGSLRNWTLIANDGIIATAGLLEGFAGAGATDRTLITAATVATIVGMLAVGGAEWSQAAAEREAQLTIAREEAEQIERQPDVELAELVEYYEKRGLTPELARAVADQLMAHDAIDAQLESEHGIVDVISRAEIIRAGIGGAIAYLLGAAIPLLVTLAVPVAVESSLILATVFLSLIVTSVVGARTGHTPLVRTLIRSLVVGLGTLGISYLIGKVIF
jgi:VIT1/CCC1 family predicted Fe2+/Mn2+ transporter